MTFRCFFLGTLIAAAALLAGCASRPPAPAEAPVQSGYKIGAPYQVAGVWYYPAEDFSYDETGIASWYGEDFHGKYTANGEVFNLNALTAAHRTLPMPSIVQVTNLENGRSIRLRVNDRGPFIRNRIIDVSRRAAQLLGFEAQGTAKVRVKILVPESIQVASLARRKGGDGTVPVDTLAAAPRERVAAVPLPPPSGVQVASTTPPPPTPRPMPPTVVAPATPPPAPLRLPETVTQMPVKATQIYIQAGAFARADNALRVKSRLDPLGPVKVLGARVNGIDLYRVRLGPLPNVDAADKMLDRVVATGLAEARIVVD